MDTAKDTPAEQHRMEKEDIEDLGTVTLSRGGHVIHCLTVIGQIEGHTEAPQGQKTTKYEHVIPQLVAVQEDPRIEGLLVLLNTVGGDVEAGLALAELIASISKPSATLVLGGGHSIGIPLAVSARHSFIVPKPPTHNAALCRPAPSIPPCPDTAPACLPAAQADNRPCSFPRTPQLEPGPSTASSSGLRL